MKPKHTNPIHDALNHLDEETVLECMNTDLTPRVRTASHGTFRRVAVAAACLTLTLAVGAAAILPLMRADRPAGSDTADGQTTPINGSGTSLSGDLPGDTDEVPFVRVQLLSFSEGTEGESGQNITIGVSENNSSYSGPQLVLRFDCAEGETVTLSSGVSSNTSFRRPIILDNDEIAQALDTLENYDPENDSYSWSIREARMLLHHLSAEMYLHAYSIYEVDASTYIWQVPKSRPDYDIVDFIIRNADGEITGAGSVCIGMKYLGKYTPLARYTVLGAERYETPASEEDVTAYLDGLRATAEDAYAAMDFSVQTDIEGYHQANYAADLSWKSEITGKVDSCQYSGGNFDFQWYTVTPIDQPEAMLRFFLFADGSFCEVAAEGAEAYDNMLYGLYYAIEEEEMIDDLSGFVLPLTDGRTLTFEAQPYTDGRFTRTKWVVVIDEGQATV